MRAFVAVRADAEAGAARSARKIGLDGAVARLVPPDPPLNDDAIVLRGFGPAYAQALAETFFARLRTEG